MTDSDKLLAEDFRFTADLLREHAKLNDPALFRAVLHHNLKIILAALKLAEDVAAKSEAEL